MPLLLVFLLLSNDTFPMETIKLHCDIISVWSQKISLPPTKNFTLTSINWTSNYYTSTSRQATTPSYNPNCTFIQRMCEKTAKGERWWVEYNNTSLSFASCVIAALQAICIPIACLRMGGHEMMNGWCSYDWFKRFFGPFFFFFLFAVLSPLCFSSSVYGRFILYPSFYLNSSRIQFVWKWCLLCSMLSRLRTLSPRSPLKISS